MRGRVVATAVAVALTTEEVGGGVWQFATTLFHAASLAGLGIQEHQPHSVHSCDPGPAQ